MYIECTDRIARELDNIAQLDPQMWLVIIYFLIA